jgi:beta-N-acetylhexosaminidase
MSGASLSGPDRPQAGQLGPDRPQAGQLGPDRPQAGQLDPERRQVMAATAAIYGCSGPVLTANERAFFGDADPAGFILFQRNCQSPDQVRGLVADLRSAVGRDDALVLIDQEGGRVQRLRPPHWRAAPAARQLVALGDTEDAARRALWMNARLIAADLQALGITVNCTPVVDLPIPGADDIIGDRAHGADAEQAARLGRAVCDGMLAGGVLPVVKHVPGHGRAEVDSHLECPVVTATREQLETTDFRPFRALADMPCAMTAHVVYRAIDPDRVATLSSEVIHQVIRRWIGFDGLLFSDDLSMKALGGSFAERGRQALAAGCDIALHCNGDRREMEALAGAIGPLSAEAGRRLRSTMARLKPPEPVDRQALMAELDALLSVA